MKKIILYFIFPIVLFLFLTCSAQEKKELPIKVIVHVSKGLVEEPQWVYWFSWYGNERDIKDSLYLQKGQTMFTFEKSFSIEEEEYNTWLVFEKNGPVQAVMKVIPGDRITVYIDENTKPFYPRVEGSVACEEKYRNRTFIYSVKDTVRHLTDSLIMLTDSNKIAELEQRIEKYNRYINYDSYFEFFEKARSPLTAYSMFDMINYKYPNDEKIDELVRKMKERFPDNQKIQLYPDFKQYPPASEHSKWAEARFEQISNTRYPKAESRAEKDPAIDKKILEQIKPYQLGDKVDSISAMGLTGGQIPLGEIQTEYVLIDFWASWCIPCRKEIPYLKEVAEKYPHLVTIYAISLDNSEKEWKETIGIEKSEMFTNVYSGQITSNASVLLLARFGVKEIPANFLLDKNRKIIATGLREDALMKKMEELLQD